MATVSTADEGGAAAFAEPVLGGSDGEGSLSALPEEAKEQTHREKAETKVANVRRGHFIIGYLFENLLASRTF
jgi:hypothetical protein